MRTISLCVLGLPVCELVAVPARMRTVIPVDRTIEAQSQYTHSLTSISITGLNKIDIYSTLIIDGTGNLPTSVVHQILILNGNYTTREGISIASPVIKISMSKNSGPMQPIRQQK
jgi:hypothetical protein